MSRAGRPWAVLSLAALLGAAPAPDKKFNDDFKAAVLRRLAARPANPAAQEAWLFLRDADVVRFRRDSAEDAVTAGAAAVYVPAEGAIVISGGVLTESGIDPRHWNLDAAVLDSAVAHMDHLLVHELAHARVHHDLGFNPPVLENELAAYAAQARFVAAEPALATKAGYAAGLKALLDYNPLFLERMAAKKRLEEAGGDVLVANRRRDGRSAAQAQARWDAATREVAEVGERVKRKEAELAAATRVSYRTLNGLMVWVAYTRGWRDFTETLSFVPLPSLRLPQGRIREHVAQTRAVQEALRSSSYLTPDAVASASDAAERNVEFWEDSARLGRAGEYFKAALARLEAGSGQGFNPPAEAAAPAAPLEPDGSPPAALWLALGGLGLAAAGAALFLRRRPAKPAAPDPALVAYIREHQGEYGLETLRGHLLAGGHKPEAVDAAIHSLYGDEG